ncbi:hypothetical protein C8F04DRAFT_1177260 [Mycena alexandri]|uniref:Uncharacterized protein n=1 Tax=Mycena alexandri TaxID=1745969 RepID=A0AAD6X720_9AGAR|nr:hypothetical protein C8F04DRAFT_1177260 [Mycena alexandri]
MVTVPQAGTAVYSMVLDRYGTVPQKAGRQSQINGAAAARSIIPSDSQIKVLSSVHLPPRLWLPNEFQPWLKRLDRVHATSGGSAVAKLFMKAGKTFPSNLDKIYRKKNSIRAKKAEKAVRGRIRPPVPVPCVALATGLTGRDGTPLMGPVRAVKTATAAIPTYTYLH